jgi:hypothetical protein
MRRARRAKSALKMERERRWREKEDGERKKMERESRETAH